jgi:hypothetical protein
MQCLEVSGAVTATIVAVRRQRVNGVVLVGVGVFSSFYCCCRLGGLAATVLVLPVFLVYLICT